MGHNVAKIKKLIEDKKNKIRERIKKFFELIRTKFYIYVLVIASDYLNPRKYSQHQ